VYIAMIADDNKKELMAQFCIAYAGILGRHSLCATNNTGTYVADASGLEIETFMSGQSGTEQIASRISFNEVDVLFFFRSTDPSKETSEAENSILRLCDVYNVPVATNIATAEVLVMALDKGNLDWREFVDPHSEYNRQHSKH